MLRLYTVLLFAFILAQSRAQTQDVQLATAPETQPENAAGTEYQVTATVGKGFGATLFLRASSATLTGATFTFSPAYLNAPYATPSVLTVEATGPKTGGDHEIVIEAFNGPLVVRDTVRITIVDRPAWRVFDISNSPLPSNAVRHITVDKNGVGYVATEEGVVRVVGSTVNPIQFDIDDDHETITGLACDATNTPWLTTSSNVFRYDGTRFVAQAFPIDSATGYGADHLVFGFDGSMWLVRGSYLIRNTGSAWTTHLLPDAVYRKLDEFTIDRSGVLTFISEINGIDRFDGVYWTHYGVNDFGVSLPYRPYSVTVDRSDTTWVLGRGGALGFRGASYKSYLRHETDPIKPYFPGPTAEHMAFGNGDIRWMSGVTGLRRYQSLQGWHYTVGNSGLPSNTIYCLFADALNTLWIGTDNGLALLDGNAPPSVAFTTSVDENNKPLTESLEPRLEILAPQPAAEFAHIQLSLGTEMHVVVQVYDNVGRVLATVYEGRGMSGRQQLQLDVSGYATGMYVLQVRSDKHSAVYPFVVNR